MSRANMTATTQKEQILKMKKSCQFDWHDSKNDPILKINFGSIHFSNFILEKNQNKKKSNEPVPQAWRCPVRHGSKKHWRQGSARPALVPFAASDAC
jgi:hypothetical protein